MNRDRPFRLTLGRALSTLDAFIDALPVERTQLVPAGSVRRFEPTVGDLTLLAVAADPASILAAVRTLVPEQDIRARTDTTITCFFQREEITIRLLPPHEAACGLIHFTGSRAHVEQLEALAQARGFTLDEHALRRRHPDGTAGDIVPTATEADVYAALDLPYVPPELRHGLDELDTPVDAETLITRDDIRGDLHVHTIWSDGRDTPETIIRAARRLGYDYVAITDHSQGARASRVLTIDRLRQQMADVRLLRERFPDIVILQGCEVDILPNGRLDFPDELLAELDIVLASLHDPDGQSGDQLMVRYLAAMRHPQVHIITHPANRTPGQSEGYDLDYDRLFRAAAETGTAVEIDGAPGHLDLDGHLARRAAAAGATLVIDSDGHFAERLGRQMRMGVGTARRGAVETRQVLNVRPIEDIRAFIAAKRARGTQA